MKTTDGIIAFFVLLGLISGLIFYGIKTGDLNQALFNRAMIVDSYGKNPEFGIDGDVLTKWESISTGGTYNYIILDFGTSIELSYMEFLAYGSGISRWYSFDLSASKDGIRFDYIIPPADTAVLYENTWIADEFMPKEARYWRFGWKVKGGRFEGGIYELRLSKNILNSK